MKHSALRSHQIKHKDKVLFDMSFIERFIEKIEPKNKDRLCFEMLYFLICLISICVQYFHIYKWVTKPPPDFSIKSFPFQNFYNYNFKLLIYSLLILSRRIILKLIDNQKVKDPLNLSLLTTIMKKFFYLLIINTVYLITQLLQEMEFSSSMYLFYQ